MAMLDNTGLAYFWGKLKVLLAGKANSVHSHAISDVNNLQTTLNGKAASQHTHVINDVTELQNALDGKANTQHNHAINDVLDLASQLASSAKVDNTVFEKFNQNTNFNLPNLNTNIFKLFHCSFRQQAGQQWKFTLPAGGRYFVSYNQISGNYVKTIINIYNGGTALYTGNNTIFVGMYLRIE